MHSKETANSLRLKYELNQIKNGKIIKGCVKKPKKCSDVMCGWSLK